MHSQDFITPSLVAIAARKIFPHRVILATPETERSMLWGSDLQAVAEVLEGMTPESIIEDILAEVDCPL